MKKYIKPNFEYNNFGGEDIIQTSPPCYPVLPGFNISDEGKALIDTYNSMVCDADKIADTEKVLEFNW